MAITTSFSARIYGQREGKKVTEKIKSLLGVEENENDSDVEISKSFDGV